MVINKEKWKTGIVQDEEIFSYKPYNISSELSKAKNTWTHFCTRRGQKPRESFENALITNKTVPFFPLHISITWT